MSSRNSEIENMTSDVSANAESSAPQIATVAASARRTAFLMRAVLRPELGVLLAVLVIGSSFTFTNTAFISLDGIANWTDVASTTGIVSAAVTLLMIGGEFDLSAGVMVGTTGLIVGILGTQYGLNIWLAIVIALIFAAAIGLVNGIVVVKTRLPSFIVTLATMFSLQGANLGITKLVTSTVSVDGLSTIPGYAQAYDVFGGSFSQWNFRITVLWWLAVTALATVVLHRTRTGNWILGVGGDQAAARMAGVPVARVKIGLFMATSLCAALVGIMVATRLASVTASQGEGDEFTYIVCAVVGGSLLSGGYGSPIGAALGATIVGMALIGIQFAGWDTDWRYLFLGVILLVAVLINNAIHRRVERRRL